MNRTNSAFLTDSYKLAHHSQYPDGTSLVFSNFTPRTNKYAPEAAKALDGVVVFGTQMAIMRLKEHFDENFFFTSERQMVKGLTDSDPYGAWSQMALGELKEEAIKPIKEEIELFLGLEYDTTHFEKLWDLGYLPLEIRALDEGTLCPIKVPMLSIHNTHPDFFWLPNFLETILSQLLWKSMTSATIALSYRKIMTKWVLKTNPEGIGFVDFQGHDFSMRGLDSVEATEASGLGHLTTFYGTDSLPTLSAARYYYDAKGFIAGSVPATEHSVMSAGSKEDEIGTFRRLMKNQPKGILSVVSDTWDLWKVLTVYLPELKDEILARDGKLVIRPDSGDPVDILCGYEIEDFSSAETYEQFLEFAEEDLHEILSKDTPHGEYGGDKEGVYRWKDKVYNVTYSPDWNRHDKQYYFIDNYSKINSTAVEKEYTPEMKGVIELLWDVFGGTINEQGYKVLDPHIGAIYGDSITHERCEAICQRLADKGFASTNVVFGIGSYTYQFNTRDTFGFACKATYVEKKNPEFSENDEVYRTHFKPKTVGYEIFKDPITDSGMKKSARGLLRVIKDEDIFKLEDQITWDEVNSPDNQLKVIFKDGEFTNKVTFEEIREQVKKLV